MVLCRVSEWVVWCGVASGVEGEGKKRVEQRGRSLFERAGAASELRSCGAERKGVGVRSRWTQCIHDKFGEKQTRDHLWLQYSPTRTSYLNVAKPFARNLHLLFPSGDTRRTTSLQHRKDLKRKWVAKT